jgi:hypothetical protein
MPSLLDSLQTKVDHATESISRTRRVVDVVGAVAMGTGIIWAIWAAFRKREPEQPKPSEQS